MAGFFNVSALPAFIQYQGQLQQQAQARQQQEMQLSLYQQAQADRQRQQAAQAAAGNALPQLLAGGQVAAQPQMPPPPQAPAPGQPSQPMQQPQGAAPLPGQGPAPGGVQPPLPLGGIPQGQGQIPPFRPMPTTPPQSVAAPQGAIPAPPAQAAATAIDQQPSGPLTMQNAIKILRDQGLEGADLFAGLQQLQPLLDNQAKLEAARAQLQFNHELQLARLDELTAYHRDLSSGRAETREETAQHHRATEDTAAQRAGTAAGALAFRKEQAGAGGAAPSVPDLTPDQQGNLPEPKAVGGYSAQAVKALGEDYAIRGSNAFTGMGRGKKEDAVRAAAINYGTAINASKNENVATNRAAYAAASAGARVNATQAAKVDAAANALTQKGGIGDQFQTAMDALNRTGVPFANEAQMAILRKSNDPRVAAFDAAENGVVSEVAQILGRGTLTVNSMEEARRVINGWKTSDQARAGLAQLKKEADTTVRASSEEVAKSAKFPKGPNPGTVEGGYRFKGGDPSKQSNWEKV